MSSEGCYDRSFIFVYCTSELKRFKMRFTVLSFPLEEFIYNYLITLSFYIIPKKGV